MTMCTPGSLRRQSEDPGRPNTQFPAPVIPGSHDNPAGGVPGGNTGHRKKTVSKGHGYNEVTLAEDKRTYRVGWLVQDYLI